MDKIFIIDAVNYLFRSYYAIGPMTNKKGISTSALYGFIRSVKKLINDFSPEQIVCVFDGPDNRASRQKLFSEYKKIVGCLDTNSFKCKDVSFTVIHTINVRTCAFVFTVSNDSFYTIIKICTCTNRICKEAYSLTELRF